MNKQELLKQADYTFQRGNRALAKKYVADYLALYPNDESAWILLARIVEDRLKKMECFERAIKINPNNNETKLALMRLRNPQNTVPIPKQVEKFYGSTVRGISIVVVIFLLLGTTGLAIASTNPNSAIAKIITFNAPAENNSLTLDSNIAPQTRAEVSEKYPQYALFVDAMIGFAIESTSNGMEGAPERLGQEIRVSEQAGLEAKKMIENALPQPGSLSSITITEQQITSWLAMEMKNSPDLPLSDLQVFLRNGKVQIWGMVNGSADATSALVVGEIKIDKNQQPYFVIESMQIGIQIVPDFLLGQMESWINEALSKSIQEQLPGLSVMNINVVNGLITVSGMR